MALGLVSAPATFQRTMDDLLAEMKGLMIFSRDLADHRRRLRNVLGKLQGANLRVNIQKVCPKEEIAKAFFEVIITRHGPRPREELRIAPDEGDLSTPRNQEVTDNSGGSPMPLWHTDRCHTPRRGSAPTT